MQPAPHTDPEALLTEKQAAELLNVTPKTLALWRYQETGPDWIRLGKRAVRYRKQTVVDWVKDREVFN